MSYDGRMNRLTLMMLLLAPLAMADEGWITHAVALSPDCRTAVRGAMHAERGNSRLLIELAETGKILQRPKGLGVIRGFAFRGDGARFVAANDHGPLKIYDTASGTVVGELAGHRGWVHAVAFAGSRIASAGRDNTLRAWDAEKNVLLWSKAETRAGALTLSPDAALLASTDANGKIQLWDVATGKLLRTLGPGEGNWSFDVAFSADGKRVAAGNNRVRVFEVATGRLLATVGAEGGKRVRALALSSDGSRLATASDAVRLWRVPEGTVERIWQVNTGIGALVFSTDGTLLGAAKPYGRCEFWDLRTGRPRESKAGVRDQPAWTPHPTRSRAMVLAVAAFDNGRYLAVGGTTEKGASVILASPDGARSWDPCDLDVNGRLYDIDAVDRTTAFAVGYDGVILRTRDRGFAWEKLVTPAPHWLAAVDFVSPKTGYVVGGHGPAAVMWKTIDGGDTWTSLAGNLPERARKEHLRDVLFTDEQRGFAVGYAGTIVETTDGGATWIERDSGSDAWLRSIAVLGKMIHVAGKGVLLRSLDDGRTWTELPIPAQKKLNDVAFLSADLGWITDFDGEILETRDAGKTWNVVYRHSAGVTAIHVSSERLVVGSEGGSILRRSR